MVCLAVELDQTTLQFLAGRNNRCAKRIDHLPSEQMPSVFRREYQMNNQIGDAVASLRVTHQWGVIMHTHFTFAFRVDIVEPSYQNTVTC